MRYVNLHHSPEQVPCPPNVLVLTPNPRAASARGVPFVSVEGLARRMLSGSGLAVADELTRRRTLKRAVREVVEPSDVTGYAKVAAGPVGELLRAGYPRREPNARLSPRIQILLELAARYRELLQTATLLDPAEVLWAAADLAVSPKAVMVVGYPRLGAAEVAFLAAVAADRSSVVLPSGGHACFDLARAGAEALCQSGWQLGEAPPKDTTGLVTPHGAATHSYRFPTVQNEVRFALTEVKRLLHGGIDPGRVALVVRDETLYGPVIQEVAWEYEVPVRPAYARPLRRTSVGAWLEALIGVVRDDWPFEATARLLSHSLCGVLAGDAWRAARHERPVGHGAWGIMVPVLNQQVWPEVATLAVHVAAFESLLEVLGVRARAEAAPETANALHKVQAGLASLGAFSATPTPRAVFLDDVTELLGLLSVPADVTTRGVELHTPLAVFGAAYSHVFVLGMAEGLLPAALRDDPLLGYAERAALTQAGLPLELAAAAALRETLSFWAATRAAQVELHFSFPERAGTVDLLPSPFFALLGLAPRTPPPKAAASLEEWRQQALRHASDPEDPVLTRAQHALAVEARRESAALPDVYDGVIGVALDPATTSLSVTELVTLGSCPFRYFAGTLLGLGEPGERADTLDASMRGTLYHATLKRALGQVTAHADAGETALAALEGAFTASETELGVATLPGWPQQRAQHLDTLRRVLRADDFAAEGVTLALEQTFQGVWQGLRVSGRVDRIDKGANGLVIWDYKTGGSKPPGAKNAEGKRSLEVQLPLYVQAAAPSLFPGVAAAEARYYSLSKAKRLDVKEPEPEALVAFAERIKRHLRDGHYPVEPDVDETICTYCDFKTVCRTGRRTARKRAAAS